MEYRRLGDSGLKVSAIGLGTNNFGRRLNAAESAAVVDQALDVGINLMDTANRYGMGKSEEYLGRALKGKRDRVVVATKVSGPMGPGPNDGGNSRRHIIEEVENSLRRLGIDYIDLYQLHWPDPTTPIAETLSALDDLVHQGKVRYLGSSNFMAWQLCEAEWTANTLNLTRMVSTQPQYNMVDRDAEAELLPFCEKYGVGLLPYFPLANGFLTGKYRRGQPPPPGSRLAEDDQGMLSPESFDLLEALVAFAERRGHTVLELAFAWLLAKPIVSSVMAGATRPDQVLMNARAAEWKLDADEIAEVDRLLQGSARIGPDIRRVQ